MKAHVRRLAVVLAATVSGRSRPCRRPPPGCRPAPCPSRPRPTGWPCGSSGPPHGPQRYHRLPGEHGPRRALPRPSGRRGPRGARRGAPEHRLRRPGDGPGRGGAVGTHPGRRRRHPDRPGRFTGRRTTGPAAGHPLRTGRTGRGDPTGDPGRGRPRWHPRHGSGGGGGERHGHRADRGWLRHGVPGRDGPADGLERELRPGADGGQPGRGAGRRGRHRRALLVRRGPPGGRRRRLVLHGAHRLTRRRSVPRSEPHPAGGHPHRLRWHHPRPGRSARRPGHRGRWGAGLRGVRGGAQHHGGRCRRRRLRDRLSGGAAPADRLDAELRGETGPRQPGDRARRHRRQGEFLQPGRVDPARRRRHRLVQRRLGPRRRWGLPGQRPADPDRGHPHRAGCREGAGRPAAVRCRSPWRDAPVFRRPPQRCRPPGWSPTSRRSSRRAPGSSPSTRPSPPDHRVGSQLHPRRRRAQPLRRPARCRRRHAGAQLGRGHPRRRGRGRLLPRRHGGAQQHPSGPRR